MHKAYADINFYALSAKMAENETSDSKKEVLQLARAVGRIAAGPLAFLTQTRSRGLLACP